MANQELDKQAQEILKMAENKGVEFNYFFKQTFKTYLQQCDNLDTLKTQIQSLEKATVSKEYVKGQKNVYANPLFTEFNKTADSANKTLSTLMRIIKNFGVNTKDDSEDDPLLSVINGGEDDED